MNDILTAAYEYDSASLCVVPVKADGSKSPDLRSWVEYKDRRSTQSEHEEWFNPQRRGGQRQGIGVVYGHVSGNAEMIEFEGRAVDEGIVDEAAEIMEASGLGQVWKTIMEGWVTQSPSGGLHVRVRVEGAPVKGNTKLASRLARDDELTSDERARLSKNPNAQIIRVLIETRGEAGFAVAEPSHGTVHPSGKPYTRLTGGPDSIPTIDAQQYEDLHAVLHAIDRLPQKETPKSAPRELRTPLPGDRLRPGDDFENRADWSEILTPHGWGFLLQRGRTSYWTRPGKDRGVSATTGHASDRDRLFVFSSSTEFTPWVAYTKFSAYALLNHGGDFKAAARTLQSQGYGDRPPHKPLDSNVLQFRARNTPPTDGANALADEAAPNSDPMPTAPQGKPVINITHEATGIQYILDAMADGQMPGLYTRAGGLCWVHVDEQGHPVMHDLTAENLRAYLHEYTATVATVKDEENGGTQDLWELPQMRTCSTILGRKTWPLPKLRGIVTTPVVRPDASLLCESGYDAQTGLYLHPHVPLRRLGPITEDQVNKAKHIILKQMLVDFPWVGDCDRAHMLGALLTPITRPFFHGPTPGFAMTATNPGSGKTLLKDIFSFCFGASSPAWPMTEEELRKSITAQLFTQGQPVVVFDNLPNGYIIKSAQLSTLLTGEYWGDRVLGRTEAIQLRNDRLWILNGNALQTGGDNGRRIVWIRLDPDCPNPDERDGFTVGDLRPWLRTNASTVVAALVTMVRGWLTLGKQQRRTVRFGDYSEWASMMAGILNYLEVPGWLADRTAAAADRNAEHLEWVALLAAWHEKFGESKTTSGKVLGEFGELIPQPHGKPPSALQFGLWLASRDGRFFGDYRLIGTHDSHTKQRGWIVRRAAPKDAGAQS